MRKFPIEELAVFLFVIIFVLRWILEKFTGSSPTQKRRKSSRPLMGEKPWKQNRRKLQERMAEDHEYFEDRMRSVPKQLQGESQRLYDETDSNWSSRNEPKAKKVSILVNGKRYDLQNLPREVRQMLINEMVQMEEAEILGTAV